MRLGEELFVESTNPWKELERCPFINYSTEGRGFLWASLRRCGFAGHLKFLVTVCCLLTVPGIAARDASPPSLGCLVELELELQYRQLRPPTSRFLYPFPRQL